MARSFNGSTDKIVGASTVGFTPSDSFSVGGWFNWSSGDGAYTSLVGNLDTASGFRGWELTRNSSNHVEFFFIDSYSAATYQGNDNGSTVVSGSGWRHVLATYDGSGTVGGQLAFAIYVDGTARSVTYTFSSLLATTTNAIAVRIGQRLDGSQPFPGSMAEVAIWNAVISAGEAASLGKGYSPAFVRPGNLVAYWPLIGRTSPEIELIGGNGGTLTGTAAAPHPRIIMPHGHQVKRYRPVVVANIYVYMRPDADSIDGGWTNELNTQTNLFSSIDETAADDADYIISSSNPSSDIVKISLSDPGPVAEPAVVSYRYCKRGEVSVAVNLTVDLLQGVTSIASWAHTDIGTTFTTVNQTLTAPQFAAITDVNDLYLQFNAST